MNPAEPGNPSLSPVLALPALASSSSSPASRNGFSRRGFFLAAAAGVAAAANLPRIMSAQRSPVSPAAGTVVTPETARFEDDGAIPNSRLPLLLYRQALPAVAAGGADDDPAALCEARLAANDWTGTWRSTVFPFHHYHSTSHEVLVVYRGSGTLQLGGERGRKFPVAAGDVIVIPAGVGHKNVGNSPDFGVVGAYPGGRRWDLLRGEPGERPRADRNIAAVPLPDRDPLYGAAGPLRRLWEAAAAAAGS